MNPATHHPGGTEFVDLDGLPARCAQLEAALGAMIAMHESGVVSLGTLRMAKAALASATDSKAGQS